jgi:hypothetical protein
MPPPLLGSMGVGQDAAGALPPPLPHPQQGSQGRACRLAGTHHLPGSCPVSNPAPSWASIVRDGARADHQPAVLRQVFIALYERSIASDLQMRIVFHHQAGNHEILSCHLSASSSDAHAPADVRRCRQRRKCAPAASCTSPLCMEHAIQQRRLHLHLHRQMLPPQQQSPSHWPSGHQKPLGAGARLSCCVEATRMMIYRYRPFLRPAQLHSLWIRQPHQHR